MTAGPERSDLSLSGKVAIVTGGGWNIGRAVALRFARAGARVAVAARDAARLDETVAAIRGAGGEAIAVPTDVTSPEQVDALVGATLDAYGTVDVLAALAGQSVEPRRLEDVTPETWQRVFAVNVFGTFLCARAVLPTLRARNAGVILCCAGGGAFFPEIGVGLNAYACAKAAVCRFTDQLTAELWETGIRVNAIEPGKVLPADRVAALEREQTASGQPVAELAGNRSPEDAAELAEWLASDRSAPLRGRLVSVSDDWWRDPARVAAVHATLHGYRLWRREP